MKSPKFIQPTPEEVKDLFLKKGIKDPNEPLKFYAYYETVGWVVGRKQMRSWRAAVAGWVLRMEQFNRVIDKKEPDQIYKPLPTKPMDQEQREILNGYERLKKH